MYVIVIPVGLRFALTYPERYGAHDWAFFSGDLSGCWPL